MSRTTVQQIQNLAVELPASTAPPGSDKLLSLIGYGLWVMTFIGVLAFSWIGISFMIEKASGDSMQSPKRLIFAFIGAAIFALAATIWNTVVGQ